MLTMKNFIHKVKKSSVILSTFVFFALPASTNYGLKGYEFGSGGGVGSSSNYSVEGVAGQVAGKQSGTNYNAYSGLMFVQQANTPHTPTFTNSGGWYNKLFFIIDTSGNPTDTTYAIAMSDDNWATTKWVQTDNTLAPTFGIANFQTYAAWGGGSGGYVIGLTSNTTYKMRITARQGNFTEGPLGVEATAATVGATLTVDIDIASTDTETAPPYLVGMGNLAPGTVTTATDLIWIDIDTSSVNGGQVFIRDQNSGLLSASTSFTIASATNDLAIQTTGFGIRGSTVTQTSGGPLSFQTPYNGASDNVGIVSTTIRPILSANNPIVGGRASIYVKAKASATTPAANDYTDLFTVIAAGSF
jgi:hypothetical protein